MSGDVSPYLALITSEYNQKPKFTQTITATVQPMADDIAAMAGMPALFDLDAAVGTQLDTVGLWVGRTRFLVVPLNVYFSWDTQNLGWDQGVWRGPFDPVSGLTRLNDDFYRIILRAVITANHWDGSAEGGYTAWDTIFLGTGYNILIQDYGNMSMAYALIGKTPDAVTQALFTSGELSLKPAGVQLSHVLPSDFSKPIFCWDAENANCAGWDVGAWGVFSGIE